LAIVPFASEAGLAVLVRLRYLDGPAQACEDAFELGWTEIDAQAERVPEELDPAGRVAFVDAWAHEQRSLLAALRSAVLPEADDSDECRSSPSGSCRALQVRSFSFADCLHRPPCSTVSRDGTPISGNGRGWIGPAFAGPLQAAPEALQQAYPETRRDPVVETRFGQNVADPWRWLEADMRTSPRWPIGSRENSLTAGFLARLPGRDAFAARIRSLFDYERISLPRKAGHSYFTLRNSGLQNQSVLYVQDRAAQVPRVLLDPNTWSADGTRALDAWVPSRSGRYLAFGEQDGERLAQARRGRGAQRARSGRQPRRRERQPDRMGGRRGLPLFTLSGPARRAGLWRGAGQQGLVVSSRGHAAVR
jgi:hypothetical protein